MASFSGVDEYVDLREGWEGDFASYKLSGLPI